MELTAATSPISLPQFSTRRLLANESMHSLRVPSATASLLHPAKREFHDAAPFIAL